MSWCFLVLVLSHRRDVPKSQHSARRNLASTFEFEVSVLSPYGIPPQSPPTSYGDCSLMKVKENACLVLHDQELDYHLSGTSTLKASHPIYSSDQELDYQIEEKVYPLPTWDELSDIHDLTPSLNDHLSRASASKASDPVYSSKALRSELCQESGNSDPSPDSLHWPSSPVTSNVHFSGGEFFTDPNSINKLYDIPEDETPEILKETHSPITAVKTSSPNKKRVSPPQNCLHELRGSSSSLGLKGGRKFILQSVPSSHSVNLKKV